MLESRPELFSMPATSPELHRVLPEITPYILKKGYEFHSRMIALSTGAFTNAETICPPYRPQ